MTQVFLIQRIWIDSLENQSSDAVGYSPVGFVETEEEAEKIEESGRTFTQKDCWAIWIPMKEFTYRIISKYDNTNEPKIPS